jgi:ADP-ribosylglycohydrolase
MKTNVLKSILYGVCVGDALGVPVEFQSREHLKENPVKNMQCGGIHNQGIGVWSDDSSLTFCLAESVIEGFDIQKLSKKFIAWKNEGYWTATGEVFDIGNTTRQSINNLINGIEPIECGGKNEIDNGNGSLMRILPLIVLIKGLPIEKRFDLIKDVSSITHAHIRSVIACFYYLEFSLQIIQGKDKFEIYENLKNTIPKFIGSTAIDKSEILHFDRLLKGDINTLNVNKIKSGGYVIHSLEASVWCFLTTTNYEEAVVTAVNLGEDTDTTGAITGGLAGMYYGFESIPQRWLNPISKIKEINKLIDSYHN